MFVFQIIFHTADGKTTEEQLDEIQWLLGVFRMDGHIHGREFPITSSPGQINAFVLAAGEDAFEERTYNEYILTRLEKFNNVGLSVPEYINLGPEQTSMPTCKCHEIHAYILFTTYLSLESSLRCAACFHPVPLYRVPRLSSGDFHDLISWQSDYQACDTLQMNCGTGERFATRQLSAHDSSLSQRGGKVCKEIETLTGKKVYYYLYRSTGKSHRRELNRKCPNCGMSWHLEESWHGKFDFRCDGCLLLSNVAWDMRPN